MKKILKKTVVTIGVLTIIGGLFLVSGFNKSKALLGDAMSSKTIDNIIGGIIPPRDIDCVLAGIIPPRQSNIIKLKGIIPPRSID